MRTVAVLNLILVFLFSMSSCNQKETVSLIVTNGVVNTIDADFSKTESFAVNNGKVVAVGTNEEIIARYKAEQTIDAKGNWIYPGFIDAHCHFFSYGMNLQQYADLAGTTSREEIYERLKEHHKKSEGDWLLGRGWDQNDWPDKGFPDKTKLDELFPDVAVYLIRIDGHAAWCNSKALKLAKVNVETKVEGGDVLLKNGKPTGMLIDNAMGLVWQLIPEPGNEMKQKALLAAQQNCFEVGLTSVVDCGLPKQTILLMDEMQKAGKLKMRINAMLSATPENLEYFVGKGEYKTERLHINTIKLYTDGALGSRGALLIEEYSDDPGNKGLMIAEEEYYDKILKKAFQNNYQVATHCIGDMANRFMLNKYGEYLKGKNDRRWRIEHAQVINSGDFKLFGKYSVIPSVQATHCTSDMYWADERLGEERLKGAYAYQQLLQQNGWLPNGTDFPVEDISPLKTFYASVFRIDTEGNPKGGFQIEDALTREQTLRSMTIWAAKASFEENEKGSLEPGKFADFVILDTDLMDATPEQVLGAKVLSTWLAGERVFRINP
ncbi:MAG: amidohydrolase [Chlorobi bacterium]|nr:amidohydrolase [Chlorobiota bacterium]